MFRTYLTGLACLFAATPALAERIEAGLRTDHVTIFPQGAEIRWSVDVDAPAGIHDLILPDLPQGLDPSSLRVSAEGAAIGSVALQSERALPGSAPDSPAVTQARAGLRAAQDALVDFDHQVALKRSSAESWRERAAMVRDLMRGDSRVPAADLAAAVDQAGGMIADYLARAEAGTREADLLAAGRDEVLRAVDRAQQALEAAIDEGAGHETLVVALETGDQPARLWVTGFTDAANWRPDYDLRLDRAGGRLTIDRGLVISQSSGADWQDATLTLSTARPTGQTMPTEVPVWMPRIGDPERYRSAQRQIMEGGFLSADIAMPAPAAGMAYKAEQANIGMIVAYDYPTPVTIRSGADALRLGLDSLQLTPEILAEAAPRFDTTAYLVAEAVNTLDQPILPGEATLHLDGAVVGRSTIGMSVPGDRIRLGFGPIEGILAELRTPEEQQGGRGLIRRSNALDLTETLILRNLTDEDWPLRIVDRVPVAAQDDLTVDWRADPAPDQTDPDGRRGVLYWQAPLAAGQERTITLTTGLRWPEGQELYQ